MSKEKRDNYYGRLLATAWSFFAYGVGSVFLLVIFPTVYLLTPGNRHARSVQVRKLIHHLFRLFVFQMKCLGIFTYETRGLEKLRPGQLVIANHPTFLDVVFLMSFIENANCIVRHGLFSNPFTCVPTNTAGYIPNIDGNQLVRDCVDSLRAGDSLIIFPEGTRTPRHGLPKMQRGAANIALAAGIQPTMITIRCSTSFLSKGVKWYDIPLCRPHLVFEMTELEDISHLSFEPKSARKLTDMFLNHFFSEEVARVSRVGT